MQTAQAQCRSVRVCCHSGPPGLTARDLLPGPLYDELGRIFSPRRLEYIAHVLTPGEIRVIRDFRDAFIIARIKRMSHRRLERFDRFMPANREQQRFYTSLQARWLQDEQYLLGTRLGRSPTHQELFIDFMNNHNGLRFRAYFAMKYPERMRRRDDPDRGPGHCVPV